MLKIKELRRKYGVTQKSVAEYFHVPQNTFSQWETGARQPDNAMLIKIADYFGVTTDYLLGRTDSVGDCFTNAEERELIVMLRADGITDEDRRRLISNFKSTYELFAQGRGIKKDS